MTRGKIRIAMAMALSLAVVLPALGAVYQVELTSGSKFESRYRPTQSASDDNKILLLTETGNWIALPKDAVKSITTDTETRGFGTVLDDQTIALGFTAGGASVTVTDGEGEAAAEDPTTRLINFLREQNQTPAPVVYNNDLVVEPEQSGGIPVWMSNQQTAPIGNTQGRNQ